MIISKRLLRAFLPVCVCFFGPFLSHTFATDTTLFQKLHHPDILRLTIKTNSKQLVSKKFKEEWQPMTMSFQDDDGMAYEWTAKVRARGNIRKQVCYFPPLKIKFKKKWLVKNGLDSSYNDLKLVVGCKKGDTYGNLVLKEYLTYRLYENLTDLSFRTQLAEVTFEDTEGKWDPITTYAFFIENQDEMATRLNGKCAKPKRLRCKYMEADHFDRMTLFQFMIGNTDWSAVTSHNVRLLKSKDYQYPVPIAYDFDYAGLVNAPYAVPGEGIDLSHVTQRLYLGLCREDRSMADHIPQFQDKKAGFYALITQFDFLNDKIKKQMLGYLDDFYDILDSPRSFHRQVASVCRQEGR